MTQANGALQPARLGIGATVGERIHLRLQKRPLNRRTVPVEDADDAAQSNRLSIRVAGVSNGEKGCCTASSSREKNNPDSAHGIDPEADFPSDESCISNHCQAGAAFYCYFLSAATRRVRRVSRSLPANS
jgi:hypothetical protein